MNKNRITGLIIGCLLLGMLLGSIIVYSLTPSITTYISAGSMATGADFVFFIDGSTYFARNGLTGQVSSSTSLTTLWDNCKTGLPTTGGKFLFSSGSYNVTSSLTWVGGSSTPPSKTLSVIGAGRWATIFNVRSDLTARGVFEFNNGASVDLEHFYIELNSYDGHGIYGKNDGTSDRSFQKSVINDIEVRGVENSYYCIYLQNPYITNTWDNLYLRSEGGGIYMECDATGYGNNHFGNIMISLFGNSDIGLYLRNTGASISLNSFERVHIDGGASGGGTNANTGVVIDGSNYNSFSYLEIEHCKFAVQMGATTATHGNTILSGYFYNVEASGQLITMGGFAEQNTIMNVFCSALAASNTLLLTDSNTDGDRPNRYYNLNGYSTGFLAVGSYIYRADTDASLLFGSMLWRKAQNYIESSNFQINSTGTRTLTITHALCATPALSSCSVQIISSTAVNDWDAHVVEIYNPTSTTVTVRINVTYASATNPSYAKIGFRGDVNG